MTDMRHAPIDSKLFIENRQRLRQLLPANSLVVVNANDIHQTNSDGRLISCRTPTKKQLKTAHGS